MSRSIFRSVEFWKASITVLPDSSFFELLRTVFGKVKTPFNKQIMLGDLEKFLSRPDIRKNIAAFIDSNDSRIIAAVAALNEPVPAELEIFFSGEMNYAELNDLVVNLEERFIIYRFLDKDTGHPGDVMRLALNPVLESILSPFTDNASLLFPSMSASVREDAAEAKAVAFDDRILAALLSFVSRNELFFRYGKGIRRKVMNEAKTLFPVLSDEGLSLETLVGGLQILGLFSSKEESLTPDYRRFAAFGELGRRERMEYCAAGILCYRDSVTPQPENTAAENGFSPWLSRMKVRKYASFIHSLCNALDSRRLYPHATLQRLIYILGRDDDINITEQSLVNACVQTGLLVQITEQYWQKVPIDENPSKGDATVVMDSPFTFLVYPEIAYNDIIKLAAASCVIEAGSTVRFELNRDSVILAFNRGITAAAIIEILRRLSHDRIDESLIFTLNDWENRHGEVRLRAGLVLTLAPEQRYLAETRPLARLITETLAPGVYMLPETAEEKALGALRKAGVAIIAKNKVRDYDESAGETSGNFYPSLHSMGRLSLPQSGNNPKYAASASALTDDFHSILREMHLADDEQDELAARINRRLVLCESQLKGAVVRYEKLEARGLDYAGKSLIAKQAISLRSPVEVIWPGRQKQERVFGIPKALEKTGGESILIVVPLSGENASVHENARVHENAIRLPLGKISLLRRIKKSIFEGTH